MRRPRFTLTLLALLLSGCAGAQTPSRQEKPMTFDAAVDALLQAIKAAAPGGVSVETLPTTPGALGWRADEETPARRITLMSPGGVSEALGLLPRAGRYTHAGDMASLDPASPGETPRLLAIGPAIVVVSAPRMAVALTLQLERREAPLLARALSTTLTRWQASERVANPASLLPDAAPEKLRALHVIEHPHWLEVETAPGKTLDPGEIEALLETGRALSLRERPAIEGGLLPVPALICGPPPMRETTAPGR